MTEQELRDALANIPLDRVKAVTCALIGHSRVQSIFFGYWSCMRCGEQVGDSLGSTYEAGKTAVAMDHYCDQCRENAKTLTWVDTFALGPTSLAYIDTLKDDAKYAEARERALKEQEDAKKALRELSERQR